MACIIFALASWTGWCALMAYVGSPFDDPILRAIMRFAAFVAPACFWLWRCKPKEPDKLGFAMNWKRGILVGVAVSLVWTLVHATQQFQMPVSVHAWLNVIILSPIAEELLFRRVAIDYVTTRSTATKSIIASAVLFALMHLPWWILSGEKTSFEITKLLGIMFVYGVVFGVLYHRTKSLWASLLPHCVNNFIAQAINP